MEGTFLMDDEFKLIVPAMLRPRKSLSAFIDSNTQYLPTFKSLYLTDRSLTGENYINPIFACVPLKNAGFEIFLEIASENHSRKTINSFILGALMNEIYNIVIFDDDVNNIDETLKILDDWDKQLIDFSLEHGKELEGPDQKIKIYLNLGDSVFNIKEDFFEKIHLAGINGLFIAENYDPIKLMNIFNYMKEYSLEAFNTATLFYKIRQLKVAMKFNPNLDLPPSFMKRLESADDPIQEGIEYFQEFVDFTKSFESNGILIANPVKQVMKDLHEVLGSL
ncbi:MAG: hypothetical protein ACFFCS_28980 [Candidatus Hodarchaeota archaeon]